MLDQPNEQATEWMVLYKQAKYLRRRGGLMMETQIATLVLDDFLSYNETKAPVCILDSAATMVKD